MKSGLVKFGKKYRTYTFMRTSVNKGKKKIKKYINNNTTMQRRQGRRNLLADEFLVKVKDVVAGLLIAGGVIYRKMVSVISTGVIRQIFHER